MTPDALDFTSMTVIGSMTPLACASMMMSRCDTMAICTEGVVAFLVHAARATRNAARKNRFTGEVLLESAMRGPGRGLGELVCLIYVLARGNAGRLRQGQTSVKCGARHVEAHGKWPIFPEPNERGRERRSRPRSLPVSSVTAGLFR